MLSEQPLIILDIWTWAELWFCSNYRQLPGWNRRAWSDISERYEPDLWVCDCLQFCFHPHWSTGCGTFLDANSVSVLRPGFCNWTALWKFKGGRSGPSSSIKHKDYCYRTYTLSNSKPPEHSSMCVKSKPLICNVSLWFQFQDLLIWIYVPIRLGR